MDPRNFLDVAKELVNKKNYTSGDIRTALSRAYYAVFLVGMEKLNDIGVKVVQSPGSHEHVYKYLHNCGHEEIMNASSRMNDLRSLRIKADYKIDIEKVENQKSAVFSVLTAADVIKVYDIHCSGKNKESLKKAIDSWRAATNN